jgi:hypothetical protein
MRYLLIHYYKKPTGKIDEAMTISNRVKVKDLQSASIILDFQDCSVVKAVTNGEVLPKNWDHIVSYYYQYYATTIERLFEENGHPISVKSQVPVSNDVT